MSVLKGNLAGEDKESLQRNIFLVQASRLPPSIFWLSQTGTTSLRHQAQKLQRKEKTKGCDTPISILDRNCSPSSSYRAPWRN